MKFRLKILLQRWLLLVISALLMSGCVAFMPDRIHHTWDANGDASWEATGEAALPQMSDKDFVGLAFSGGGSRAALFAAAGAEALHDEGLLSHVTHVSSVSGGSMASSYLVASPPEQCGQQAHSGAQSETQSDRVACLETYFARYKGAMRENYFLPMEMQQVLHPNRFLSPTRRVTSLQETFDNKYLDGRTFGDLADGRILLINAASYDDGRRFVFSNMAIPTVETHPPFFGAKPSPRAVSAWAAAMRRLRMIFLWR